MLSGILVGLLFGFLLLRYLTSKRNKLPPGPRGLPFFGNAFQLDRKKPHETATGWSDKYGDVFKIKIFGNDFVILNSFDTIYEALVTKTLEFAGRPPFYRMALMRNFSDDIAFTTFSKKWVFLKKVTMQTLKMSGDLQKNLEFISQDLLNGMMGELRLEADKGPLDIKPFIHRYFTGVITYMMYGHRSTKENLESLMSATDLSRSFIQPAGLEVILDLFPITRHFPSKAMTGLKEARDKHIFWLTREIENRRANYKPGNPQCYLDALFDAQEEAKVGGFELSDNDIYGLDDSIIFGGFVVPTTTMHCLIAVLTNMPKIQKRMATDINELLGTRQPCPSDRHSLPYVEATILETFRYATTVPFNIPHFTTMDTQINGYDIPKDTRVLCNLWKLHHNPEHWDDPWEFKPERFLDEEGKIVPPNHINRRRLFAFGAGRRVCIGEKIAKKWIFLMITSLIQQFEFFPAGPDLLPCHDPRTYINGITITPQTYLMKLVPKLQEDHDKQM